MVKNRVQRLPCLVGLAIGQHHLDHGFAAACQGLTHPGAATLEHRAVTDERNRGGIGGNGLVEAIEPATFYIYGVVATGGGHVHQGHSLTSWFCSRGSNAFTTCGTGMLPVSKTMSATSSYSGSRAATSSRMRACGSSVCKRGRLRSRATRRYSSSGVARR